MIPNDLASVPGGRTAIPVLLSRETLAARVSQLGREIAADHDDHTRPLLLVGVLKGAALFLADLVRSIDRPLEMDFVALASYGAAYTSSGEVRILKDLDAGVAGKDVIIVEDILDTGMTMRFSYLIDSLRGRHARSVKLCVLLDKPARRQVSVEVQYRGFAIDDVFVVGYGMDYNEKYRNLGYVGVLPAEELQDLQPPH